ncbi:MAG: hypothetical protein WDO19_26655 [Bacteroidota bacterium]
MKITSISFIAALKYLQAVLIIAVILYFGKKRFLFRYVSPAHSYCAIPYLQKDGTKEMAKSIAITACLLLVTFLIIALVSLFIWQVNEFRQDAPLFIDKLKTELSVLQQSLLLNHGLSIGTPGSWIEKLSGNIGSILQSAFFRYGEYVFHSLSCPGVYRFILISPENICTKLTVIRR